MNRKNSLKYLHYFFKNYNEFSNKKILPKIKKSKTNKDMNNIFTKNDEINQRILKRINFNFIYNQFNTYCRKSNRNITDKYINSISDELYNSRKTLSRNKRQKFRTQTNFFKSSKNNLFYLKDDFIDKNEAYEDEKVYDFSQKFSREKDKINQLRSQYNFYTLPIYKKDEISSEKIKKIFEKDFTFDLDSKFKPKKRIIAKIKNHSFNEKVFPRNNKEIKIKNIKKEIIKITNNKKSENFNKYNNYDNLNNIEDFINNDLKKFECFNSLYNSDIKLKLEKPIKKRKTNIFLNYMKLKNKGKKFKLILKNP